MTTGWEDTYDIGEDSSPRVEPEAPAGTGWEDTYDVTDVERTQGDEQIDKAWKKIKDLSLRPLNAVGDARDQFVKDYREKGLVQAGVEQIKDVPILGTQAELALSDEDNVSILKRKAAEELGLNSWDEVDKLSKFEAIYRIGKKATDAISPVDLGPVAELGQGLGKGLATNAPVALEDVSSGWWGEDNAVSKFAISQYEEMSGKKWVGEKELAHLAATNPQEYDKVRSRQMNMISAIGRGINKVGAGLVGFMGPAVEMAARANMSDEEAGDVMESWNAYIGSTPVNMETIKFMAGAMVGDPIDTIMKPEERVVEDPVGTGFDLLSFVTAPAAAAARMKAVRHIAHSEGMARAAVNAIPAPFVKSRGNLAARHAAEKVHQLLKSEIGNNEWVRSWTEAYPNAKEMYVESADAARYNKAGFQEVVLDAINDVRRTVGEDPMKWDSKPSKAKTKDGKAYESIFDVLPDNEDVAAAVRLHEEARRLREAYLAISESPELASKRALADLAEDAARRPDLDAIARGDDLTKIARSKKGVKAHRLAKKARAAANKLEITDDQMKILHLLDDPKIALQLSRMPELDSLFDFGFAATRKKIERLKNSIITEADDAARLLKRQHKLAKAEAHLASLQRITDDMYSLDTMKKQGAWLEYDGKQVGGIDASLAVLDAYNSGAKSAAQLIDDMVVRGPNGRMVAALEETKELMKLSSYFDDVELRHGVIDKAQASAQLGMRFNMMRDAVRAKELAATAGHSGVLSPLANISETSQRAQHLKLTEDLRKLGLGDRKPVIDVESIAANARNIGGERWRVAKGLDGKTYFEVPKGITTGRGVRIPKYGSDALGLGGRWLNFDEAKLVQDVMGARLEMVEAFVSVVPKGMVLHNLWSHAHSFVSDTVNMIINGMRPDQVLRRGVDLAKDGPKMSIADKMLSKRLRHAGVFQGAAVESIDRMAGLNLGSMADIKAQIAKLGELPKTPAGFAEWLWGSSFDDAATRAPHGAALTGWRFVTDQVGGWFGVKQHLWDARDRVFRVGVANEAIERFAKHKYNFSKKDLQSPKNMKIVLDDPESVPRAIEATARYMFDYGKVARGPQIFGDSRNGLFRAGQRVGALPFVAFPIKATGLFAEMATTRPLTLKAIKENGEADWALLDQEIREERMMLDRSGQTIFSSDNEAMRDGASLQPIATMLNASTQSSWVTVPLVGLLAGVDKWGQKIDESPNPARQALSRFIFAATHSVLPPEWNKLFGVALNRGAIEKITTDELKDRRTDLPFEPSQVLIEFATNMKFDNPHDVARRLGVAGYLNRQKHEEIMGSSKKRGKVYRSMTIEEANRALVEADREMLKRTAAIVHEGTKR